MPLETLGLATFAFTAGATTFFAPCAYPLLPGYLAYYIGTGDTDTEPVETRLWRAAIVGLQVLAGFAIVYLVLGAVVAGVGASALGDIVLVEFVVGILLVGVGTGMALGRPVTVGQRFRLPERRRSTASYVLFGVVYAGAAAGCTAPLFLAVAGASLRGGVVSTALGIGGYAAGMGTLLLTATMLSALGRDAVLSRLGGSTLRRRLTGVFLVLAGAAQLYLFLFRYQGLTTLGLG